MSIIRISDIEKICRGKNLKFSVDHELQTLLTDSRKVSNAKAAAFFAIKGPNHDGHDHIGDMVAQGIQTIVVEKEIPEYTDIQNLIRVPSTIAALQQLATHKRAGFNYPVIGITGSNGKTTVKEWLDKMTTGSFSVVKSPRSFNSQLGVPLSIWEMKANHNLAIFEAGISKGGEMEKLAAIIQPQIGILTNIGTAHEEGFPSKREKLREKLRLFERSEVLIYHADSALIREEVGNLLANTRQLSWAFDADAEIMVSKTGRQQYEFTYQEARFHLRLPLTDAASVENLIHCICCLLWLKKSMSYIQEALNRIEPVDMRLKLNKGINSSYIIDDSYNNDLAGLETALDLLVHQKQYERKTVILSDLLQVNDEEQLYSKVNHLLHEKAIDQLITIGPQLQAHAPHFNIPSLSYPDTSSFLEALPSLKLKEQVILVKGARPFQFERIVKRLAEKAHQTVLEINLDAITHNLNYYRSHLKPGVKVMVMVKAFAYGSGISEIAQLLQFHKVHYLAVAYTDEGIALRKSGIHLPIMIMNTPDEDFDALIEYQLEPEIFSLKQLMAFSDAYAMRGEKLPVHININTGMNRLGFEPEELDALATFLLGHSHIEVKSAFTHLAGADEEVHNTFSLQQLNRFAAAKVSLEEKLAQKFTGHALNSAGIQRFPQHQFDMVRLGIGLYGLEASGQQMDKLQTVGRLKTVVSQVKCIKAGESIGYGRAGIASEDMQIATVAVGYADGYTRAFSKGKGAMKVNGQMARVVGNVCMDMCMLDVTGLDVKEGDEVTVFGDSPDIVDLARQIDTIPYEILTNVSERVKRVYLTE